MKHYAVGYLSLFDGELKVEVVEADTDVEAALQYLGITDHPTRVSLPTMEEIHNYVSDGDAYICVKELPN